MIRKLVKDWNDLPAGAGVTLDPAEQVALVDADRLVHLEKEGHLERLPEASSEGAWQLGRREIPAEVRTQASEEALAPMRSLAQRLAADAVSVAAKVSPADPDDIPPAYPSETRTSSSLPPSSMEKGGHNDTPQTARPKSAPAGQSAKPPADEEP